MVVVLCDWVCSQDVRDMYLAGGINESTKAERGPSRDLEMS